MSGRKTKFQIDVRASLDTESAPGPSQENNYAIPTDWFREVKNKKDLRETKRDAISHYILCRFGTRGAREYLTQRSKCRGYRTAANAVKRAADRAAEIYRWDFYKPSVKKLKETNANLELKSRTRNALISALNRLDSSGEKIRWKIERLGDSRKGAILVFWDRTNAKS